MNITFKTYHH